MNKTVRSLLVLLIVALGLGLASIPVLANADATHRVYRTDGEGVWLHSEASLHQGLVGVLPEGSAFTAECWVLSDEVNGNPVWLRGQSVLGEGWATDFYIDTSWDTTEDLTAQGIPPCDEVTSPAVSSEPTDDTGAGPRSDAEGVDDLGDPCLVGSSGSQWSEDVFGGHESFFDREASLYQVCSGFGAPEGLVLTTPMKCALIAAAATYGGPAISVNMSRICTAESLLNIYREGDWLGEAGGLACGFFGEVFATGVGIFVAGATAETGPGAVALGVGTYKAISAGMKVACGGLFDDGTASLGTKLEADHETRVAADVVDSGKCLHESVRFGITSWSAADC